MCTHVLAQTQSSHPNLLRLNDCSVRADLHEPFWMIPYPVNMPGKISLRCGFALRLGHLEVVSRHHGERMLSSVLAMLRALCWLTCCSRALRSVLAIKIAAPRQWPISLRVVACEHDEIARAQVRSLIQEERPKFSCA